MSQGTIQWKGIHVIDDFNSSFGGSLRNDLSNNLSQTVDQQNLVNENQINTSEV